MDRRRVIQSLVGGSMLMPGLIAQLLADTASPPADPLAPKTSHFPAKAKRVIFIFSNGGVSHMDTFDHKPELFKADGRASVGSDLGFGIQCCELRMASRSTGGDMTASNEWTTTVAGPELF